MLDSTHLDRRLALAILLFATMMAAPVAGEQQIRQISILGERHSGTRWMYDHIGICFNHTIPVERHLTRYKHWFQKEHGIDSDYRNETLVLAMFRDPYDWLEAMRLEPHHMTSHIGLEWPGFLTKPWTTPRVGLDLNVTIPEQATILCNQKFRYNEVVSCFREPLPKSAYAKLQFSNHQPLYELRQDGSGKPFANILELRAAKIHNFLAVKYYQGVSDLWPIQYEYLLHQGTESLISRIENATGILRNCSSIAAQPGRESRPLLADYVEYLDQHLDWSAEELIGYGPRGSTAQALAGAHGKTTTSFLLKPDNAEQDGEDTDV